MASNKKSTDLDRLQGTWNVSALEIDGQEISPIAPGACIVVEGARFTSLEMGAEYEGDMTLDGAAKPGRFDLTFTIGPEAGNTSLGIYELDGDSWKMCLTTRGGKRPSQFATKPGTGHALQTLVREGSAKAAAPAKPKKSAATSDAVAAPPGDPAPELDGEWTMQSILMSGEPLPPAMLSWGRRVSQDGEVKVMMGPQTVLHARYAVDRSQNPMAMNYVHVKGGAAQAGIYKLDGGLLTTCMGKPGGNRPDAFVSVKDDGRTLTVWKKA